MKNNFYKILKTRLLISMGEFFVCPICGNKDLKKIGYINGVPYCRACITFKGENVQEKEKEHIPFNFTLNYELTSDQKRISNNLLRNYKNNIDTLLIAVCGAGKTEIVYETISYVLKHKGKVGFAIPRRDVVIEITQRLKQVFSSNSVIGVYGGHTEKLDGDIICLTTHQLFRYERFFDLLIIDEIDAFPFNGDDVLFAIMKRSLKGHLILMSATPSDNYIKEFSQSENSILRLNTRFHNFPLPVPNVIKKFSIFCLIFLLKKLNQFVRENKPTFVFVATIEDAKKVFKILNLFIKGGSVVHSKEMERSNIIALFREGKYKFLVTTAVLERGVTLKNLQVIVYKADHELYTSHTLIQIAGRVGRKIDAPKGEVIFIVEQDTEEIKKCISEIERANEDLC